MDTQTHFPCHEPGSTCRGFTRVHVHPLSVVVHPLQKGTADTASSGCAWLPMLGWRLPPLHPLPPLTATALLPLLLLLCPPAMARVVHAMNTDACMHTHAHTQACSHYGSRPSHRLFTSPITIVHGLHRFRVLGPFPGGLGGAILFPPSFRVSLQSWAACPPRSHL